VNQLGTIKSSSFPGGLNPGPIFLFDTLQPRGRLTLS
jgi:hypothetical protein